MFITLRIRVALGVCSALWVCAVSAQSAAPADPAAFNANDVTAGSRLYAQNCAVCHGEHMEEPGGGFFDLRTFPPAQRSRFFNSVSNGKNSMPPWRSLLTQEQIAQIFAYVVAGEKK